MADLTIYDRFMSKLQQRHERATEGKIVLRGSEIRWEQSRQSKLKWYLNSQEDSEDLSATSALQDWDVFVHEVHSPGMHRHQGGVVIYVVDGEGYTIIDDEKVDWRTGDLLLLPVKPGGVNHQHFNTDPDKPSTWIAFIYRPMHNALGSYVEQVSVSPDYTE